jgi:hypothetical protein
MPSWRKITQQRWKEHRARERAKRAEAKKPRIRTPEEQAASDAIEAKRRADTYALMRRLRDEQQ